MRADFDKWWLVPLGILTASGLVALCIIVVEPLLAGHSTKMDLRAASRSPEVGKAAASCSGAFSSDYACYQKRYQDLVGDSGVEATFAELKDEYTKSAFVRANCHQITHVIGRAALVFYGDIPTTYERGDDFCTAGYYHGAMEAAAAKIGPDKLLEQADTLCSDLREHGGSFFVRYNCVHGLGHGFMGVLGNELFESLEACDVLSGGERDPCYAGVFMQNMMVEEDPSRPSKYLKADQPLYPCTKVEGRYKTSCYRIQTSYALRTRDNDFGKVFGLCSEIEDGFRPACYQGLGGYAAVQSIQQNANKVSRNDDTSTLCKLGENDDATTDCFIGAAKQFVLHYRSNAQAKVLCESLEADLRAPCLEAAEEYYESFKTDWTVKKAS